MKKILILFCLIGNVGFGLSSNESELFCFSVDEFTKKKTLNTGWAFAYKEYDNTNGVQFRALVEEKKGKYSLRTLYVRVFGIKGCVEEGSKLDVLFENGEMIQLINWGDSDCKGINYFPITEKQITLFKNNDLYAVNYTNIRNDDSMFIRKNLDVEANSYIRNVLVELDKLNDGLIAVPICKEG